MKLIPKYQSGGKTYQYRRYGNLKSPTNARVLDEAGNIELSLPVLYKKRFGGKLN